MRGTFQIRPWLATAALCTALGACGGDDRGPTPLCPAGTTGSPPNCVAIAPPCTQTVVNEDTGGANARTLYFGDFSVPDSGRLDITVDWTFPESRIGVYLVPANTCTLAEFNGRSCTFLVRSEPSTQKPRKISTPNFQAGNYRWLVANFSEKEESISHQIVLAKGSSCPALAGGGPSALARGDGGALEVDRAVRR